MPGRVRVNNEGNLAQKPLSEMHYYSYADGSKAVKRRLLPLHSANIALARFLHSEGRQPWTNSQLPAGPDP
jgi:hypothetical protein